MPKQIDQVAEWPPEGGTHAVYPTGSTAPAPVHTADSLAELALDLFLEHGFDATPMSLIAQRAGLTKAGVYHHVESKEHLLYVVHKRHLEQLLLPLIDAAERESDAEKCLRWFLREYALLQARDPTLRVLINEVKRLGAEHGAEIRKAWRRGVHLIRDAVAEMKRSGRCAPDLDPTYAAFAAIGMCSWICNWFDYGRPDTGPDVARTMVELFMDGLLLRQPMPSGS